MTLRLTDRLSRALRRRVAAWRTAVATCCLAAPLLAAAAGVAPLEAEAGFQARGVIEPAARMQPRDAALGGGTDWISRIERHRAAVIRRKIENAREVCLMAGQQDRGTPQKAVLSRILGILDASPLARTILQRLAAQRVVICLDGRTRNFAYYLSHRRLVAINADLSDGHKVAFLAHELAHVPQHPAFSDDRRFPPQDLILLRRMREAAAEAVATRIAWQLKASGYDAAWKAKMETVYGDIAATFAAHMQAPTLLARSGPPAIALARSTTHRELRASRAAFEAWFAKRLRLDVYDAMTLRHIRRIARDRLGLIPASRRLSNRFLRRIADIGGESFLRSAADRDRAVDLTGPAYRAALSATNLRRLQDILNQGDLRAVGDFGRTVPTGPS